MTYTIQVKRSGRWWAISSNQVPGLHSQAKRLDQVAEAAAEATAMLLDIDKETIEIEIEHTDQEIINQMTALRKLNAEQNAIDEKFRTARKEVATMFKADGFPVRDIAQLLECSPETASKLTRRPKELQET